MSTLKMLSPREVADMLSMSRRTIYRWMGDGTLPSVKVGLRAVRVSERSLESWLNKRPHMPSRVR